MSQSPRAPICSLWTAPDWCAAHGKSIQDVEKACWAVGAAVQDGVMFHGPCHLRINLASPRARIEEAFRRMDQYVFNAE